MKQLKITFMDGTTEIFEQNNMTYFLIDNQLRIIYIIYPKSIIRIPFESIKMIEETREDEKTK